MTDRCLRRYYKEQMKKRAHKLYPRDKRAYRWADNLCACSCPMCGNPRHHQKGDFRITLQERRELDRTKER